MNYKNMETAPAAVRKYSAVALRDALIAAVIMLSVSALTGYVVYKSASEGLKQEVQYYILSLAKTAAEMLDGDRHQQITKPEEKGTPFYEDTRAPFFKILRANPNIAFIYTVIPKDGKQFFILDSKIIKPGEKDDTSGVMEEYKDASDVMKQALARKQPMVEEEAYTDEWGTFLSGYAPIYNSKHEYLGIVGADIRLADYLERLSKIRSALLIGMVIAFFFSGLVGFGVWWLRSATLAAETRNQQQQQQMRRMEHSRALEQQQQAELAEREKRALLNKTADSLEASVKGVVIEVTNAGKRMQEDAQNVTQIAQDTKDRCIQVGAASGEAAHINSTVSAAAEELSASIKEISAQTQKSSLIAAEAASTAEDAKHRIQSLAEKSENVSKIISVITGIARQINLLALNATIEAARAGEAGRGFTVVASEVKNLANQVAAAAGEITQQIGDMQGATKISVESVMGILSTIEQVSHSTEAVAAAVEEQSAVTNEIAQNIARTATSAQQISQNILNVQNGADQTGDTARKVLETAKNLSSHSQLLAQNVDAFLKMIRG